MKDRRDTGRFSPPFWARNPHVQSIFGSLKFRASGANPMVAAAREMIIPGVEGSCLLGYFSPQLERLSRGLVALIHGWEGSSDSTYILSTGRYLYSHGYDIFRLNLRDHGASHHLNEGLFHGALLEETLQAVANISQLAKEDRPFSLVGFSMGGNFALRIALKHPKTNIRNFERVIAISPALDPFKATLGIDESLIIYRHYFLKKWKTSLRRKETLFPDLYNFSRLYNLNSCLAITEAIMPYFPDFPTYQEYFRQYTLTASSFDGLSLPVTIISSLDDPIIPADDLLDIKTNEYLCINMERYGGHCGFFSPFPFGCFYEREIVRLLDSP